jgi:hypothetical protein
VFLYLVSHLTEKLWQGLRLGDDWEKIRVVPPSRHYMLMQVSGNASTGNFALIHAYVEAVGPRNTVQRCHRLLRQQSDLSDLSRCGLIVAWDVSVRANENVSRVVRVKI